MKGKSLTKKSDDFNLSEYAEFLGNLKNQIQQAQIRAVSRINSELATLYWEIGREILQRQKKRGWGAKVIERLSKDLRKEFPEMKGFSRTNLLYMRSFADNYPDKGFVQQVAGQIPWFHNCVILDKVKSRVEREFYIRQTIENGWSRNIMTLQIESKLYERQGKAQSNFERTLPKPQSDLAQQLLKDPYNFDFLTIGLEAHERELESNLLQNIKEFLLEMGVGFAFIGSQYHLEIGGQDFYIDLLFYHLKLRAFIVIDLKTVDFKPEFAGKMNFYLSGVDDLLKHTADNPSIGLILCKTKNKTIVEYALRDAAKPIGISTILLTKNLPEEIRGNLPTVEEIENLSIKFDLKEAFEISSAISSYGSLTATLLGNLYNEKRISYDVKSKMIENLRTIQQKVEKFNAELSQKRQTYNNLSNNEIKKLYTFFNKEIMNPFSSILLEMNLLSNKTDEKKK
ncbi:MAG: PDDEXK nuclease domain-containing protein [Pyrinomonadaceae bacterium]